MTLTQYLASLANKLNALTQKVNSMSTIDPAALTALTADVAVLKEQMSTAQATQATISADLAAVKDKLAALEANQAAVDQLPVIE